jgi:hypothetical protein
MEKGNPETKAGQAPRARIPAPVIVDLGAKSKKAINKLKCGDGKLMNEVEQAVELVRSNLDDHDKNKQIIPVLVIYRKKRKRGSFPCSPLSAFSPLNFLR